MNKVIHVTPEYQRFINLQIVLAQGEDFLQVHKVVVRCNGLTPGEDGSVEVKAAHLPVLAFAIELLVKALHFSDGVTARGHKLNELYRALPAHLRTRVRSAVDKRVPYSDDATFDARLDEHANAFVEWRYFYERGTGSFNSQFCSALADAIVEVGHELIAEMRLVVEKQAEDGLLNIPKV